MTRLKAVAKKLHKVDVDVKLLHSSQNSDHGEFLIQEKNNANYQPDTTADDVDILSNGIWHIRIFKMAVPLLHIEWCRAQNIVATILPRVPISRPVRPQPVHQAGGQFTQEDSAGQRPSQLQSLRYPPNGMYTRTDFIQLALIGEMSITHIRFARIWNCHLRTFWPTSTPFTSSWQNPTTTRRCRRRPPGVRIKNRKKMTMDTAQCTKPIFVSRQ